MKFLVHHARHHAPKVVRFGLSGGLGACVDFSTLFILKQFLHVPDAYAVVLSSLPALVVVFTMNKYVTFSDRAQGAKTGSQAVKFILVYAAAFLWNSGLSIVFLGAGASAFLAKFLAIGCVAVWNYVLLHSFVFRGSKA